MGSLAMEVDAVVNGRTLPSGGACLLYSSCPFSQTEAKVNLPFELSASVYLEVNCRDEPLFTYMARFVGKKVKDARSIRTSGGKGSRLDDDFDDVLVLVKGMGKGARSDRGGGRNRKREVQMPIASIGLGWHAFDFEYDEKKTKVVVLFQRLGEPTGDSPSFFDSMVLFIEGSEQKPLLKLCQAAKEAATQQKENRVTLWRFDTKYNFWTPITRRLARSLDSVVIEEGVKQPLLDDVEWFVKDETRAFYAKHGIPYHRCYLFHGEPGTGKTSFISALAGHLERNLCFIQMQKEMTDDTFRTAMSQLPSPAMVVLEDVDALFSNHREADHATSSLSFSGFLNCLDGLGAPDDVVVCLTTNHPEKLDPAVMRPGRIDLKVPFKKPTKEVASQYFLTFYPGAAAAATEFGHSVGIRVQERKVSMAQLQHFFLACHRKEMSAEQASDHIKIFTFDEPTATSSHWTQSYG